MTGSQSYRPPYTITSAILSLVAEISQAVGRNTALTHDAAGLRLRRINRIRTIQGTLAIEGNDLSQEQITAILEGKQVVAPPREIQEVRNAIAVYDSFDQWRPEYEADLLEAHGLLMQGLIHEPGKYRSGASGVMGGQSVVHIAPPPGRVPELMGRLFNWLTSSREHALITGAVFHYEFEFIHPFADGNGRMGRLWQSLILARWHPLFADIPVESMILEHQADYYRVFKESTNQADCAPFVEFMLNMIMQTLKTYTPQVSPQVTPQVKRLLEVLRGEMSREDLQKALNLRDRKSFREIYLKPALAEGLIEMTMPARPSSRFQKYRLAYSGRRWLGQCDQGG